SSAPASSHPTTSTASVVSVSVEQQTQTDLEPYYDNEPAPPGSPLLTGSCGGVATSCPHDSDLSPSAMFNGISTVGNKTSIACNTSPSSVSSITNGSAPLAADSSKTPAPN